MLTSYRCHWMVFLWRKCGSFNHFGVKTEEKLPQYCLLVDCRELECRFPLLEICQKHCRTSCLFLALASSCQGQFCKRNLEETPSKRLMFWFDSSFLVLQLNSSLLSSWHPLKLLLPLFLNEFLLRRRTRADTHSRLRHTVLGASRQC